MRESDQRPVPVPGNNCTVTHITFLSFSSRQNVGRPENVVGWYHSHPGYGCWLSGVQRDGNTAPAV